MKKQIQEMMKESEMMNNTNKHAYMEAEVNVMFTQMHANKGIRLFGERDIAAMIKELKPLYEWVMPANPVVFPLNPNEVTGA